MEGTPWVGMTGTTIEGRQWIEMTGVALGGHRRL